MPPRVPPRPGQFASFILMVLLVLAIILEWPALYAYIMEGESDAPALEMSASEARRTPRADRLLLDVREAEPDLRGLTEVSARLTAGAPLVLPWLVGLDR